ncbi:hypothetical protein OYE22_33190 [Streptomyces sp. 71268]|uniref:hypothetical protein n=1 Tax=Streptomyces sp. 71268 TaxID=3002640 RepID=UPI0023F651C3|nr:hypothetical protein [Streptomyces sp. 71268]WEV29513.1 hypothetical protein OYE22_33190 [Streptomyces sp. 71268]
MTCPHCQARLLRKERAGSTCSRCQRAFALDPKVYGRGMNDLHVRRRARQATQDGRLKVTLTQFWYLTHTDNRYAEARPPSGKPRRYVWVLVTPVVVVIIAGTIALPVHSGLKWWLAAISCLFVCGMASKAQDSYTPARPAWASIEPSYASFRAMMCGRWTQVYGALPAGIVDDELYVAPARPAIVPRVALLCSDRAVVAFLSVNGLPRRLEVAVAPTVDELPAGVPVVVLHDASARGALLVLEARAALPGRVVVDAGLSVRTARDRRLVRRLGEPSGVSSEYLRAAVGLPLALADWLADGWWYPVAAVPPARLVTVVERAVEQAVEQGRIADDPRHRRAATTGFMTWPAADGAADPKGGTTP